MQPRKMPAVLWLALVLSLGCALPACGVKAPPLPPLPVTPEQSDRGETLKPSPTPKPTASTGISR